MRVSAISAILVLLGLGTAAQAQTTASPEGGFRIALSIGTSSYTGAAGSVETVRDLVFVPYRPTLYGVQVGLGRRVRIELGAQYGEPGLAIRGDPDLEPADGFLVVAQNVYTLVTVQGGASVRLLQLRGGPVLRGAGAIGLEHWSSSQFRTRTLLAGQASLRLEIALTGRLDARIEAGLGVSGSPFHAEELPEGFEPRNAVRRMLSAGLSWKVW